MKERIICFWFSACIFFTTATGQINCPTSVDLTSMQTRNPSRYQRFVNLEGFTSNYVRNQTGGNLRLSDPNGLIVIPVVVHILHRNEAEGTGLNISLAQIQSQIDVLNEDFRRLNADRTQTPSAFLGVASDFNVEFRLACQDPTGNSTNGVTRRFTNKDGFLFKLLVNPNDPNDKVPDELGIGIKFTNQGGEDAWPTDRYLNIWVGSFIDRTGGYATFPADFATDPNVDGVVISTPFFGRIGSVTPPQNKGRYTTHEVGHWLNLRHIWGDNVCGDDFVADTPRQQGLNSNCPSFPKTSICSNVSNGPNGDMFMNYMDYTDNACMNIFTNGQKLRGRALFAAGGPRASFLDNYFKVVQPTATINCSGPVNLINPNCLPVSWSVVSGPGKVIGTATNQVTVQATSTGSVVVRAIAGNYTSEATVSVNFVGSPATNNTLIYPSGQRGVDPVSLCASCGYNFVIDFVPETLSYTWVLPSGFAFLSGRNTSTPSIRTSSVDGTYILYCSANNLCTGSWARSLTINVSSGGGQQQRIAVYPNPASNSLTIESIASSISISDTEAVFSAKLVDQFNIEQCSGETKNGKINLDTRNVKSGLYYLQVKKGLELITQQIVISR